ncbi:hypothetical protein OHB00_06385 [Streptomyces sp. NBC_00631]
MTVSAVPVPLTLAVVAGVDAHVAEETTYARRTYSPPPPALPTW